MDRLLLRAAVLHTRACGGQRFEGPTSCIVTRRSVHCSSVDQPKYAGSQDKRQTAKAEKLEKIRKGEKAVDDKHRTAEQKQASKDFYKQVRSCDYIGCHCAR